MDVLKRIEFLRKQKGWSVYKLCNEADLSPSALTNLYARNNYPSIPTVMKICDALQISLAEFFNENCKSCDLNPAEQEMLEKFRKLNNNEKTAATGLIENLLEK